MVKNPRKDTVSREVLRHPEFQDLVQLTRIRDHFMCEYRYQRLFVSAWTCPNGLDNVESAGQYNPEDLIPEAVRIMLEKIGTIEQGLDALFETDTAAAQ